MAMAWKMDIALDEAREAALRAEVPVGAVVLGPDGRVLARAGNRTEEHGPRIFAHAAALHRPEVIGGVRERECAELLRAFFRDRR